MRMVVRVVNFLLLMFLLAAAGICFGQEVSAPASTVQKTKDSIQARGAGAKIKVTQVDGTRVAGVIADIREDDFDVAIQGAPHPVSVRYADVRTARFEGRHYARNIAMYTGLAFAGLFVVSLISWAAMGGGL